MFILKNVYVPFHGKWKLRDVAIDGDLFIEISDQITPPENNGKAVKTIYLDYESYLLPAMIDPHVHVREPGFDYKEDWETCSKAALKGGVSAIIDMPNNKIPIDDIENLKLKDEIAISKSYVNYGLYVALTDNNSGQIAEGIFDDYICGVKIYMDKTTGGLIVNSVDTIKKALYQTKPVLAHTGGENGLLKLMEAAEDVFNKRGKIPSLYICHLYTTGEIEIIKHYKKKLPEIVAEVTPHHLFLNRDDYNGLSGVLPPLSSKHDQKVLWNALVEGLIDVVGTDHAPHTIDEKSSDRPPSGFPGLETALPLLFNSLIDGEISLNRLLEITSGTASKLFGIKDHGKIEVGRKANCTLLVRKDWTVGEDGYQTKCNWSPFDGKKLKSKVYLTIVNGNISYLDGSFRRGIIKRLCVRKDGK